MSNWQTALVQGVCGVLSSKRALAAIASGIAAGVARIGFNADAETILLIISPFAATIVGYSLSDTWGKGRIEAEQRRDGGGN